MALGPDRNLAWIEGEEEMLQMQMNSIITPYLRKNVCSLPSTQMRGLKVSRTAFLLAQLERKMEQHELKVATTVDCCLEKIQACIKVFSQQQKKECACKLEQWLTAKDSTSAQPMLTTLLNEQQLQELETELKQLVQQQLHDFFGLKSVEIAALHAHAVDQSGTACLVQAMEECRRTLGVTNTMLAAGNKVWQKSVEHCKFARPITKLLGKTELATVYLDLVDCNVKRQQADIQQQLTKRLNGIIDNSCKRLYNLFQTAIAQSFYQLYDDIFAKQFIQQKKILLVQLKTKHLSYSSPCFTKQAG